jgi:hypothetical protein
VLVSCDMVARSKRIVPPALMLIGQHRADTDDVAIGRDAWFQPVRLPIIRRWLALGRRCGPFQSQMRSKCRQTKRSTLLSWYHFLGFEYCS